MSISGHRNEQSLQHYNRRPSTSQLKRCSEVLSEALGSRAGCQSDPHVAVQRRRSVESLQINSMAILTTTLTSQSFTAQNENLPNFGSLFSGCSIGNVNVNFNMQQ